MAIVERGNVVLTVPDKDIDYYIRKGYKQTDGMGNIIKEGIPTQLPELQSEYAKLKKRVAELENSLATVSAELAAYKEKSARKTTKKA